MEDRMSATLEEFLRNDLLELPVECQICFEEFDTECHTAVLATSNPHCHHVFGRKCLMVWLTSDFARKKECPVCANKFYQPKPVSPEPISPALRLRRLQSQVDALQSQADALHSPAVVPAVPAPVEIPAGPAAADEFIRLDNHRAEPNATAEINALINRNLAAGSVASADQWTVPIIGPVTNEFSLDAQIAGYLRPPIFDHVIGRQVDGLKVDHDLRSALVVLFSPIVLNAQRAALLTRLRDPAVAQATGHTAANIEIFCNALRTELQDPATWTPMPPMALMDFEINTALVPEILSVRVDLLVAELYNCEAPDWFHLYLFSSTFLNAYRAGFLARLYSPTIMETTGRSAASIEELRLALIALLTFEAPAPVVVPAEPTAAMNVPLTQPVPAASIQEHLLNAIPGDAIDYNAPTSEPVARVLFPFLLHRFADRTDVQALSGLGLHFVSMMIDPTRLHALRARILGDVTLSEHHHAELLAVHNAAALRAPIAPVDQEVPRAAVAPEVLVAPVAPVPSLEHYFQVLPATPGHPEPQLDARFLAALNSPAMMDVWFPALMNLAPDETAVNALNALDPRVTEYILHPSRLQLSRMRCLVRGSQTSLSRLTLELIRAAYNAANGAAAAENHEFPLAHAAPVAPSDDAAVVAPELPVLGFALNVFFGAILVMLIFIMMQGALGSVLLLLGWHADFQPE
ncbi:hypothetical protein BU16DRAFT_566195 [Lophium mytilinum]|uniref:RING-type domain-containing protein n=1 Tax=Lophium mytilinum TaxID=390894 RepID=A0A6A6QFA5_9PEZI|nr:hypothetical protein BU16DRAFT_566195 [Lophium mytilinum]